MKCWICGDEADSGEHLIKASDIKSRFGPISPDKPIYIHSKEHRNRQVRGLKSRKLKSDAPMCRRCNNERTQPYDLAWQKLSEFVSSRQPRIKIGDRLRLKRIFPGSVKSSMLNVHLYFVKAFGCKIVEGAAPINVSPFAEALLQRRAHPSIYIAICPQLILKLDILGSSEVYATDDKLTGRSISATWLYHLDRFTVRVVYVEPGREIQGMIGAWHPTTIKKYLRITKIF